MTKCPHDDCGLDKPEISGYEPEPSVKYPIVVIPYKSEKTYEQVREIYLKSLAEAIETAPFDPEVLLELRREVLGLLAKVEAKEDEAWRLAVRKQSAIKLEVA